MVMPTSGFLTYCSRVVFQVPISKRVDHRTVALECRDEARGGDVSVNASLGDWNRMRPEWTSPALRIVAGNRWPAHRAKFGVPAQRSFAPPHPQAILRQLVAIAGVKA